MNAIPKISQLSGRVWRFLGCNPSPMTLQGTNIYLLGTGSKRLLVDAGQPGFPDYINALTGFLKDNNVTIEDILITHWHHDHAGALTDLKTALMPPIMNSLPIVHKFKRKEPEKDIPPPDGYILKQLEDNQQFSVDGATIKVLFTPGHTSDHAALYLQEEEAVFSGDCILGEGTAVFENLYELMASLEKILRVKPKMIYPGHGHIINDPEEKIQFYLEHRRQREQQILQVLKSTSKPMTVNDIVDAIYTDIPVQLKPAAAFNVTHHLEKLLIENRVKRESDDRYVFPQDGKL